ncbi:hypothetical protein CLAFUW4_01913 [Fulvia fulva]|uniref:Rhodopsin domain-containing protein n=1 Tax=Passalora fulva TaxID=5499 RepID=A0A9Q8P450_PASFU|nr:uncharacterized protein CLAFUR5_01907 [Fulvia fulva]KAK4636171.1 hypothetical protein CLAFUR4_01908 [Fulvia fulva]KAK4636541.1 hypothetical protein CLAFUR0_01910 [Fulvia fulva]UJO12705.1 hypothetical protein CLAFUR5_01907 [Fulvia fulva]WPV09414.1 hypothetical protein CLAFUW4_01913 [Fulvia fulva]WPV23809.1 hypothetical protein CLAFUW7_01912 [Fulvia fulva]
MTPLVIESWIWWSLVILIAISRFISRWLTLGSTDTARIRIPRYQLDDYIMMVVLCFYTTNIVAINIVNDHGSNLLPPGFDVASLTPEDIAERSWSSKLVLVVEQTQCVTIWGAKLCLIILYHRLTQLRCENIGIKVLAGYVIGSFVIMEILYFGVWCQPFHNYWAVPTPSRQCDAATNHLITNATFNLSSDLIMLAIGLPMFLRMKLRWRKKVPVVGVFSLGIFVVLAAILNKVYSFSQPFGSLWSFWYVRESSTALLVANLPFVWKFFATVTGLQSSKGGTRRGTAELDTANSDIQRENSMLSLSAFLNEWSAEDSEKVDNLQRINSRQATGLSLGEMLTENKEERPDAHDYAYGPTPPSSRAVVNDGTVHETIRRDSDPDRRRSTTPASSTLPPSMQSSWTAGSFV